MNFDRMRIKPFNPVAVNHFMPSLPKAVRRALAMASLACFGLTWAPLGQADDWRAPLATHENFCPRNVSYSNVQSALGLTATEMATVRNRGIIRKVVRPNGQRFDMVMVVTTTPHDPRLVMGVYSYTGEHSLQHRIPNSNSRRTNLGTYIRQSTDDFSGTGGPFTPRWRVVYRQATQFAGPAEPLYKLENQLSTNMGPSGFSRFMLNSRLHSADYSRGFSPDRMDGYMLVEGIQGGSFVYACTYMQPHSTFHLVGDFAGNYNETTTNRVLETAQNFSHWVDDVARSGAAEQARYTDRLMRRLTPPAATTPAGAQPNSATADAGVSR